MADPNPASLSSVRPVTVLRIPQNVPTIVRFLGPLRGLITHWPGRGNSLACPGVAECPPSVHRLRVTWKGYAPVEHWCTETNLWWCRILEVTEALEEILHAHNLRGEVWILNRQGSRRRNTPVTGLLSERLPSNALRPAFPLEDVLKKLYSVQKLLLDVPNPVPGRLILPASTDPAPVVVSELDVDRTKQEPPADLKGLREQLRARGFLRDRGRDQVEPTNGTNGTIAGK